NVSIRGEEIGIVLSAKLAKIRGLCLFDEEKTILLIGFDLFS
ncbi:unnamed protein product, partial [marine sediment metagenome]